MSMHVCIDYIGMYMYKAAKRTLHLHKKIK